VKILLGAVVFTIIATMVISLLALKVLWP